MIIEDTHDKIIEYLKTQGKTNTYRLARELGIDRDKILNITKQLERKKLVEFKSDIVKIFKVAAKEKRTEEKLIEVKKSISKLKREVKISRIKYFHINDQLKILNFEKDISINMLITLWNKFGLNKRDIDEFVRNNRNLGIFLNLKKRDIDYSDDWKRFIDLVIPKKNHMSKSNNILVAKDYSMLLLVTERKFLSEDMKNLNKIISRINLLIKGHNDKNFGFQTQTIIR